MNKVESKATETAEVLDITERLRKNLPVIEVEELEVEEVVLASEVK